MSDIDASRSIHIMSEVAELAEEIERLRAEVKQLREELEMWKNSHSPA